MEDQFRKDVGVRTRAEIGGLNDRHYGELTYNDKVAQLEEQLRLAKLEQKIAEPKSEPKVANFDETGRNRGGRPEFQHSEETKMKVIFSFLAGTPKAKIVRMYTSDHVSQYYVDKWTKDKKLIEAYKAKKGIQ